MNMSQLSAEDQEQIKNHGISLALVDHQLGQFKQGFPPIQLNRVAQIGDGIQNSYLTGSEVMDEITLEKNIIGRKTNRAGGIEGGISNGEKLSCVIIISRFQQ